MPKRGRRQYNPCNRQSRLTQAVRVADVADVAGIVVQPLRLTARRQPPVRLELPQLRMRTRRSLLLVADVAAVVAAAALEVAVTQPHFRLSR